MTKLRDSFLIDLPPSVPSLTSFRSNSQFLLIIKQSLPYTIWRCHLLNHFSFLQSTHRGKVSQYPSNAFLIIQIFISALKSTIERSCPFPVLLVCFAQTREMMFRLDNRIDLSKYKISNFYFCIYLMFEIYSFL